MSTRRPLESVTFHGVSTDLSAATYMYTPETISDATHHVITYPGSRESGDCAEQWCALLVMRLIKPASWCTGPDWSLCEGLIRRMHGVVQALFIGCVQNHQWTA